MKQLNWNKAIYYGEVFGFLFAWAIGLAIAFSSGRQDAPPSAAENIVAASPGASLLD